MLFKWYNGLFSHHLQSRSSTKIRLIHDWSAKFNRPLCITMTSIRGYLFGMPRYNVLTITCPNLSSFRPLFCYKRLWLAEKWLSISAEFTINQQSLRPYQKFQDNAPLLFTWYNGLFSHHLQSRSSTKIRLIHDWSAKFNRPQCITKWWVIVHIRVGRRLPSF